MKHKMSQHQRMMYRMALTPTMRQSLQLLSMPTKDLIEYIDSVVASNPFLQKILHSLHSKPYAHPGGGIGSPIIVESKENPRDGLVAQLRMAGVEGKPLEIAEYLIYEMDENGYIAADWEEVGRELAVDAEEVRKAVLAIQDLEPAGIGACDVQECLQIQLRRAGKEGGLEYKIVADCMNELARNDARAAAEALGVDAAEAQKAINNIKKLNPRPASTILAREPGLVIPDMIATFKNKKVYLELNKEWMPRLKLYNPYEDKLEIVKDAEVKKFMKENMNGARHLIDNIKRREDTMCRVADYILKFQKDALANGAHSIKDIKKLTINDVAAALKLHPSTISRTVSNKYVLVAGETIPLKNLLSHGIKKENGETTSKTSVKDRIREIIKNEDGSKPLSDSKIQSLLEQEGIKIQRRTIAKYRDHLRLLPSSLRRRGRSPRGHPILS